MTGTAKPKPSDTLSVDTHVAMLGETARDKSEAILDSFKSFSQIYSAIIGGSLALRLQYGVNETKQFSLFFDLLVAFVAVLAGFVMIEHYRSWFQF